MEVERYSDPQSFAREVNLPLLGVVNVSPVPAGAPGTTLLATTDPEALGPVVDVLTQTRKSLTLRSLLLTGFPHDPEFFAAGLALAREWSTRGLKIAVVDLDFRHPTAVRPKPHPNEGYVDGLEYGCSFQRLAWELVAGALWLIGPGSHPPEEERLAEHPDWERTMRIFSSRVDVTLYLAPFLDRKGFVGRLSKRMDGVLLAASVERASRTALRDAFLELWGSDAPMIGCLGIGTSEARASKPLREEAPGGEEPVAPAAAEGAVPLRGEWPRGGSTRPEGIPRRRREEASAEVAADALVAKISDEVMRGSMPRVKMRRKRLAWITALVVLFVVGGGAVAVFFLRQTQHALFAPETLPAGTERVLPAGVGGQSPAPIPGGAPSGASGGALEPAPEPARTGGADPTQRAAEPPPSGGGTPSKAAAPAAPSPARSALPYRVHVASFRSENTVGGLVEELRAQGLDAWYEAARDRKGWFRVFIGHYATYGEAAASAERLLRLKLVDRAMAYPNTGR